MLITYRLKLIFVATFLSSLTLLICNILYAVSSANCISVLQVPMILLTVFLTVTTLVGVGGAYSNRPLIIWVYIILMLLVSLLLFSFSFYGIILTKGHNIHAGHNDHAKISRPILDRWDHIVKCMKNKAVCRVPHQRKTENAQEFYMRHLPPIESGCCNPPAECGYSFISPTVWDNNVNTTGLNGDCYMWESNEDILCFKCDTCKAAITKGLRKTWMKIIIINVICLICIWALFTLQIVSLGSIGGV